MPKFVILRHDAPQGVHFDLMLEVGDALRTWALAEVPEPGGETTAEALPDHRIAYLDYEGPVSGDRGTVVRYDRGTYTVDREGDREWVVQLAGEKLLGRGTLRRVSDAPGGWRFSLGRRTGDG
jgi:hypothetical protein